MKRYLLKAGFRSSEKLEKAKSLLLSLGVKPRNIDYISAPKHKGQGLKFEKRSKGEILAFRFYIVGAMIGFLVYFINLYQSSDSGFWITFFSTNMISLILSITLTGTFFLGLGYFLGQKMTMHLVKFGQSNDDTANLVMSANLDQSQVEDAKNMIQEIEPISVDVTDSKLEVELGLRRQ